VRKAFAETREVLNEVHTLVTGNRIFMDRMVGVGALSAQDSIAWGITGPLLRATGVPFDLRRVQPYWAYDRVEFEVPLGKNGDNFDRYLVRMAEMEQSMRMVEQALERMPSGAINVDYEGARFPWTRTWTGESRARPRAAPPAHYAVAESPGTGSRR
jgi:NADH:ubiquinone oxidoreductase 49 kD subunit 7